MDVVKIVEEPLFYFEGCCPEYGQEIALYAEDLHNAKVGDSWSCEDQDCYPNRTEWWTVTVTAVYRDEDGVLLKVNNNGDISLVFVVLN